MTIIIIVGVVYSKAGGLQFFEKMSLFKAREWWSTVAGYEELHTTGSLALASVNVHENFTGKGTIYRVNGRRYCFLVRLRVGW